MTKIISTLFLGLISIIAVVAAGYVPQGSYSDTSIGYGHETIHNVGYNHKPTLAPYHGNDPHHSHHVASHIYGHLPEIHEIPHSGHVSHHLNGRHVAPHHNNPYGSGHHDYDHLEHGAGVGHPHHGHSTYSSGYNSNHRHY